MAKPKQGSNQWLKAKEARIIAANAKAVRRQGTLSKLNERKAMNVERAKARTAEYYKTQRSKSRATKISAAAAAIMESNEKTERVKAQEQTARMNAQLQYSQLINGNQGSQSPLNEQEQGNQKDNASGWVNWN